MLVEQEIAMCAGKSRGQGFLTEDAERVTANNRFLEINTFISAGEVE